MESSIHFFSEDIDFQCKNPNKIKAWISRIATRNGYEIDQLNYIFCSDSYLLALNKEHLDHDYYTDILTFPTDSLRIPEGISADVFISIDRVKDNAMAFKNSFYKELLRVMIHGLLHLMGYDDHGDEAKKEMRAQEDAAIIDYESA